MASQCDQQRTKLRDLTRNYDATRDQFDSLITETAALLKEEQVKVLEVRARYVQVRADRFPGASISARKDRRRIPGRDLQSARMVDTYDLSGPASFEFDLWGRLAKASRAAWQDILQEEENRRTVAQSVVAEAISLYLQMEAVERRLQIAHENIAVFDLSLRFPTKGTQCHA